MKVSVTKQNLAHGLSVVSRAVAPRSTLPVLSNILVATDEGRLRLSATNLELGITCWIPAQIAEEGSTTVPARTFSDLVATLPNDMVTLDLTVRTQTLKVTCAQSVTEIKGIDAQEFPPMPVPDLNDSVDLNVADFKQMIQQVVFSASTDEARPVLQGVSLTVNGTDITMAATDGFRISVRKATLSNPVQKALKIIIPARALSELARVATDGEQSVSMVVPSARGQVVFRTRDTELVSQLIDGNFPDYNAIVPRSFKTRTVAATSGMLESCRQVEVIARDGSNIVQLNIQPREGMPGQVEFSAHSEETGASENKVDATIEGVPLRIAFNVRFLREVLEVIKSPSVALETNANNTPGVIRPVGDDQYVHVIMPMHLG